MAQFKPTAVQVTIYLTEGDSWHHRPLHLEILKYLREENVVGAVVFHAVAGFLGRGKVQTAHLVEAGGELPVVISFVDTDEHVDRVLTQAARNGRASADCEGERRDRAGEFGLSPPTSIRLYQQSSVRSTSRF